MRTAPALILVAAVWSATAADAAQYVYPSRGQSHSRQAHDEAACSAWARHKTGVDPSAPPPPPVRPGAVTGSGARVVGAAGGAAIAGIAGGNAGTGALVGAATGGIVRRIRNRNAADQQNAANLQAYHAAKARYWHARAACLTGRGYSVK